MKNKKHNKIINNFDRQKKKHLEKLATKMLKKDDVNSKLKEKSIGTNFLNLF